MKYFAYGSNMNFRRMRSRNANYKNMRRARLYGYRLKFNKLCSSHPSEGFANLVVDPNGIVEGVLYEMKMSDIISLDRFEGFPNQYIRIHVKPVFNGGNGVISVTYIANSIMVKDGLLPSKSYLSNLLQAKDFLSDQYYSKLVKHNTYD